MAAAPQPKVKVFNDSELMDDAAAEAEELGQGSPSESGAEQQAVAEPTDQQQPATEGGEPKPEPVGPRAEKRIQQLLEERRTLQQQLTEANSYRERWARIEERQKLVSEAQQAAQQAARQQQEAEQRPDPAIDPVGAKIYDQEKLIGELLAWKQNQEQQFNQLQQGIQVRQTQDEFNDWVVGEAQKFSLTQPDYQAAANHAADWRINMWAELGMPRVSGTGREFNEQGVPISAKGLVMAESQMIAAVSKATGIPFAPWVYKLAQSVGYKANGAPAIANGNGNGVSPQAASAAGRVLAQAARGQAMQGLNRASAAGEEGKSRYRDMSAAEIANVPEGQWQRDWANPALRPDMEYAMKKLDGLLDYDNVSYAGRGGR